MRVILIAGLPASGKTILLAHLREAAQAQGQSVAVLDDPHTEQELAAFTAKVQAERPDWVFVADPALCETPVRQRALESITNLWQPESVRWKFFANNPQQCEHNASKRQDGRNVVEDIRQLSRRYTIPADAEVLPVWAPLDPKTSAESDG